MANCHILLYFCRLPFKEGDEHYMALLPLIKYIYNHGTEEVVRRGKKIFLNNGVSTLKIDEISATAHFRVRNDLYQNYYTVTISKYESENQLNVRCQCPYNMGEICRHEVAALFYLNDLVQTQQLRTSDLTFDQSMTQVRMLQIELKYLRLYTSAANFAEAEQISLSKSASIISAADELVQARYELEGDIFDVSLKRHDDKTFTTTCNCVETQYALCKHKTALFLQLINNYGSNYFDSIRNWDTQKNKLLQQYGFSLHDNLQGKFEFTYVNERPILRVLDASIKKIVAPAAVVEPTKTVVESDIKKRIGVVINYNEKSYPHFAIDVIDGEVSDTNAEFVGTITKLDIQKYIALENYLENDRQIISLARKILAQEVEKYIAKNSSYGDVWASIVSQELSAENKKLYIEFIYPKIQKIFESLGYQNRIYKLEKGQQFVTKNLKPLILSSNKIEPIFNVVKQDAKAIVNIQFLINNQFVDATANEIDSTLFYIFNNTGYLIQSVDAAYQTAQMEHVPQMVWHQALTDTLIPLSKTYSVNFGDNLITIKQGDLTSLRIYLNESGENFILKPVFVYDNEEANWNEELNLHTQVADNIVIINRDVISEQEWIAQLLTLSDNFKTNKDQGYLYLHAQHALKGNWFYELFQTLKKWKVQVFGFEGLKRFKIRSAKPTTSIHVSSGVDWFDTDVKVNFDGLDASVDEIRKALSVKRNYVNLSDGTYGLLPEEWLTKYSLLFKMADSEGGKLRVSKFNFSIIDELYDAIDDESIKAELEEKKKNLLQVDPESHQDKALPEGLTAVLRPYQHSGFGWLHYLNTVGWGGLLADDMGLGKTIQTLTFLLEYFKQNGSLNALVVCPTTLLYNWENEIKKFTPELTYFIHHSNSRTNKRDVLAQYNVVITTYGTLRSDIEMLAKDSFDYVILDESQAIKNPTSKVTKSAMLLNTKNRIALSGTPMQNNTFDIYAQMNFLNPGMLGSKEFFKDNFATPIDKFQESTTKEHLRKLIYPFLLRRTKEQVAKDLPDKTEITLYCEMESQQRKIYDGFKNMYRAKLLGTIEEQGMDKSRFAILQGLMKLRQICDSPAILSGEEQYGNHSAKLVELVRELKENTGEHKVLIFSQFLGMLALIQDEMVANDIEFEYFDGSYSSKQRESAINNFQNNDKCRAFLISLKAGGTGLNLTAADYVYIMDPWWNPAVEQQAIDRTHRIGQTKNIFAYRFICKDTVEEKIVELKQKKNSLVKDIIADDDGFVKTLSKDDVMYLFS
jgi:SNF2 family DNA or RNA helicase